MVNSDSNVYDMKIRSIEDIKTIFDEEAIKYDYDAEQELVDQTPEREVSVRFENRLLALLNYADRFVEPIPREVRYSGILSRKIHKLPPNIQNELSRFERLFIDGENVNNHLSKTIFNSNKTDYLFNLWRIKHFHMNIDVAFDEASMSTNRSEWLLFAIVNDDAVYFLDIERHPHGSDFVAFKFFNIVAENNWLPIIGYYELNGVSKLSIDDEEILNTDDAIYTLIKGNINRPFKYNNRYYMSTGVSCRGNSVFHVRGLTTLNNTLATNPELKYKAVFFTSRPSGVGFSFIDRIGNEQSFVIPLNPNKKPFWGIAD